MSSSTALVILGLEGLPTYYSCEELVHFSSDLTIFHIPIIYDLIIPIAENPDDARRRFESVLLKHIAISYGLSDGSACTALGDEEDSKLIEVSTSWDDLPTANPGKLFLTSFEIHVSLFRVMLSTYVLEFCLSRVMYGANS